MRGWGSSLKILTNAHRIVKMTSAGKELNLNLEDDSEDPSVVDEEEGLDDEVSKLCVCVEWTCGEATCALTRINVHFTPVGSTY